MRSHSARLARFVARLVALVSITSLCAAQTPVPASAPQEQPSGAAAPPAAPAGTIVVPQGTEIYLTLVSTIRSKSTRAGDDVRAQVAFPVTVGTNVAIPAGTYVQGTVIAVDAKSARGGSSGVQIHFTTLLFSNGYTVALDAENQAQRNALPAKDTPPEDEIAWAGHGAPYLGEGFQGAGQQTPPLPPLPPLPRVGPSPGVVIGISLGGSAVLAGVMFALAHHRGGADYILHDSGWQFEMTLRSPLALDAARVAAALSTSQSD